MNGGKKSMRIPDVMDLTRICNSFPDVCAANEYVSGKIIERENIINTIDTIFSGETQVIGIEGEEGIGKTFLLAQLANTHPFHTISVFIKPNNHWGYDPAVIRYDLCNQLNWLFTGQQIDEPQLADESLLQQLILKLHKRARTKSEFYYFLVDGLDELPEEGRQTKQIILDMLPLGFTRFRFIISGDPEKVLINKKGLTIKSYPLAGFIYDETRRYFEGFNINSQCLQEIHRTFKGIPGRLATIRRIFESQPDLDCDAFVQDMPVKLNGLFEIEWTNIDEKNQKQLLLIGIIAFDRKSHSVTSLGDIIGLPVHEILKLLQGMKFINAESQEIVFVSEAFRRFVTEKLSYLKSTIHDLLIDHLYRDPESEEALAYLPGYLEQAGRLDDLIDYLSPEHFEEMLHRTQSLSVVEQKADLGLNTAMELKRDGELMRFSIQKATIRELGGAQIWRSEIEARMALKQYSEALALAQTTILKEDKLHLLAVVARRIREQESGIEPELIEQIKQIYKEIDHQSLGSRSVQIAADLIYVLPELAVELVEKANSVASDEINDLAFATLSIANHNSVNELENREETMRNLDSRIKNPHVRQFSIGVGLLAGKYSATQVIAEVQKFKNISEQLFMLRQWAKSNSRLEDAYKVVEYALKVTIRTTTYAPNARIFRELATPLPFITNVDIAKELVGNFDSQKAAIEHLGPTEDYIRLLLILAETEEKYDTNVSASRLIEAYLYTTYIEDLAIKTACMARVVNTLENIRDEVLTKTDDLKNLAEEDLMLDINTLLLSTANHFGVIELVIRALARTKYEMAFDFARMLNTQERRNLAFKEVLINYLRNDVDVIEFAFVDKVITEITDTTIKDLIILKAIERLESMERISNEIMRLSMPILDRISLIEDPGDRCEACTLALSCLERKESPEDKQLQEKLLQVLNNSWTDIDLGWHRVNIGYKIAASLSKNSLENAMMYLKLTDEYRKTLLLDSDTATFTYMSCIFLSIRAYSGLLPKNKETLEDYQRLTNLINRIPSNGERVLLWCELALRCYLKNRPDLGGKIVNEHVKPLLQNIPEKDYRFTRQLTSYIAPTLYNAHKLTAFDVIEKLPFIDKDKAYSNICVVILTKVPPGDPYDGKEYKGLTYEDIIDICEILNKMVSDNNIFYFINCITDTMSKRKAVYSGQQKADIARRIGEIIEKKFPDPKNIQHDGYKIASEAVIQSLVKSGPKPWLQLITRAKKIPNLADSAFILGIIAEAMPSKEVNLRLTTLNEAKELVDKIPATLDRIDHYESLASFAANFDIAWAKQIIQHAVTASVSSGSPELHQVQKNLINLAYRIDPEMASSLASLVDDDEARKETRSNLKREILLQELKKSMTEHKKVEKGAMNSKDCAKAARMVLGSLNAGRTNSIHVEDTREFFKVASNCTFGQAFSIMSWIIENIVVRYGKTDHVTQFLRPAFEATALGAELAGRMAERASEIQQTSKADFNIILKNNNFIVQPNSREEAIQYIRDWFETDVKDYVKICDPYFGLDDLELLQIISSVNPACKVQILTSVKHQTDEKVMKPYSESYLNHWRLKISDQNPPDTDIVIVGSRVNGKPPIHDRWWLTDGSGLRVGTSFNSLGNKLSEISIISKDEAKSLEDEVDQYLTRKIREYKDEKLQYEIFNLA